MAHALLVVVVFLTCCLQSSASAAADDTTEIHLRALLILCDGTSLLSYIRLKPAFDIAMDTVDERLESGVYRNFHFNVTFFPQCGIEVLGMGTEAYYRLAYDVIIGPPSSTSTIGKFGNLVKATWSRFQFMLMLIYSCLYSKSKCGVCFIRDGKQFVSTNEMVN